MAASEFDDKFLADITKVINQDMDDAIMGSLLGFATEQEATSICFEDINEMCAEYGRSSYSGGYYTMGFREQDLKQPFYDMEFEIKFLDFKDVLKEPEDTLTPEAKFDMAMKAVI